MIRLLVKTRATTARAFPSLCCIPRREFSRINILDEKERADENLFFSKQDEALLKRIFEASQMVTEASLLGEGMNIESSSLDDKIKLVFMKVIV